MVCPKMHTFWLSFSNPATERQYDAYRLSGVVRALESGWLYMSLAVAWAALVRCVFLKTCFIGFVWIVHSMYTAWELNFRRRMNTARLARVHTRLVCVRRVVDMAMLILFIVPDASFSVNVLTLLLKTGIISTLGLSLRVPNFSHHSVLQILCTSMCAIFATKGPCEAVMESSAAASLISDTAKALDRFSDLVMLVMADCLPVVDFPVRCPCVELVVWSHVFISTIVLGFVLWLSERSARIAFIRTLSYERRMEEGLDSIEDIKDLRIVLLSVAICMALSPGWNVSRYLARGMEVAWGLAR